MESRELNPEIRINTGFFKTEYAFSTIKLQHFTALNGKNDL